MAGLLIIVICREFDIGGAMGEGGWRGVE